MKPIVQYLKKFTGPLGADQLSDGELLEQFVRRQDSAAFELLMQRHGPMVLNVCRKLLRDPHDADDAYQAVFLVLVRRAASLEKRPYLGGWLYQVAQRTGLKARMLAARRHERHQPLDDQQAGSEVVSMHDADTHSVLSEELSRLPEKYRAPLVFCYLQGKSTEEAAQRMGCPRGTILWRLSRGRDLLRERLNRRGVALTATAVTAALTEQTASAGVPAALAESTARACLTLAAGKPLAEAALSTTTQTLAHEVNRSLTVGHYRIVATIALGIGLVLGAAGWLGWAFLSSTPNDVDLSPVTLPADPQAPVVTLDLVAADAPAGAQPLLSLLADGTALTPVDNDLLQANLEPAELQELLSFIVRKQAFFAKDSAALEAEMRQAAARKGLVHGFPHSSVSVLRVQADGRTHEVRLAALGDGLVRQYPEVEGVSQLNDIQQRLMKVVHLVRAGGKQGVALALDEANRRLQEEVPGAPALTASDLHEARVNGPATEVIFERRGLGAERDPFTFVYARVRLEAPRVEVVVRARLQGGAEVAAASGKLDRPLNVTPKPIAGDKAVKYDYDIVYVRSPRPGDEKLTAWAEAFAPARMQAGSDLVLLHPDGSEEVLVEAKDGAVADPYVSFDGAWVFYAYFHDMKTRTQGGLSPAGSDIYKIHVPTRKVVRLTHQERTPNTGVVGENGLKNVGVFNLGPCPLPGGRIMFTSNRNGFVPPKEYTRPTLQLFTMDEDGQNVEMIGHLNIGSALHPTILRDGRVMFSSYESQGVRDLRQWGIWTIHPDGTNWGPLVSAFRGEFLFHFQTQLSSGDIVVEEYYNLNNQGFGTYYKLPESPGTGNAPFGPGYRLSERNPELVNLHDRRMPFTPTGMQAFTPFVTAFDSPAPLANRADPQSPRVGKFTHPSGAPENHLLTVWSPGAVNINGSHKASWYPAVDSGIYLIKSGQPLAEPGDMLLIKNDPRYNEQWPRALVPYRRVYGVEQPALPKPLTNDGTLSKHLPAGTPFGLVGSSSLYKRESFPDGVVRDGKVAAEFAGGNDPYEGLDSFNGYPKRTPNWLKQGADAGKYSNSEVHAVRILAMEPTTIGRKRFWNYA
ncbi:MAG: sigma-70 family RNA polymerase sigma factor, partial [Gemmataceae bacterium]